MEWLSRGRRMALGARACAGRKAYADKNAGAARKAGRRLLAGVALIAAGPAAAADAVDFAPHRAVYEITLDRATPGSGVAAMTGRMVYEMAGSTCEGYTQNMRFVTRTVKQDGGEELSDLRTSSFEDGAAQRLRFSSTQLRDGQPADATQGDAARGPDGVKVAIDKPKKQSLALGSHVYFPMQHSLELISAAKAGRTQLTADLYDGSEKGDKANPTHTVIGRMIGPGTLKSPAALKNGDKLDALTSWPMAISYFDPGSDKKDVVPSYELGFRFYENGVSTKLHIDYGEFSVNGDLRELTFLDKSPCSPGSQPNASSPMNPMKH